MFKKIVSLFILGFATLQAIDISGLQGNKNMEFLNKMAEKQMDAKSRELYESHLKNIEEVKKPHKFIIYFFSQAQQGSDQLSLTDEVGKMDVNDEVRVAPIARGFDDGTREYVARLQSEMKTYTHGHFMNIKKTTRNIKFNPRLFSELDIKKVPVVVSAVCKDNTISKKDCKFLYRYSGETSLTKVLAQNNIKFYELFEEKQ